MISCAKSLVFNRIITMKDWSLANQDQIEEESVTDYIFIL